MSKRKAQKKLPAYYLVTDKPAFLDDRMTQELQEQNLVYQGCLMPIGGIPLSTKSTRSLYYHVFSSEVLWPLSEDLPEPPEMYVILVCIPVGEHGTLDDRLGTEGLGQKNLLWYQQIILRSLKEQVSQNLLMLLGELSHRTVEILTEDKSVIEAHVIESPDGSRT